MATPNLSFQNFFTSTLASGITASDTTIYLNSLPTGSEGYLVIEPDSATNKEIIYFTSKGANFVTLPSVAAGRGVGGTSAVSHSSGVTVQMNVVAEHFKALQDGTAFAVGGIGASAYADGWTPILGTTPNTVTYNGNRNYDLVFNSVDLSSTISPGQKLKLTRTVAAPTQSTSLNGTTQYYSRASASVAGMTFTNTFTAMAWVKISSYATSGIISRFSGTNGWDLSLLSTGQILIRGMSASSQQYWTSYASIPLNKWVHIAASMNMSDGTSSTNVIYIDGINVPAFKTGTQASLTQGGNLEVGTSNGTNFFPGKIAQAAVFSAVLNQATIRGYISQGLSGSETSLISAYSFNNSINDLNTTNANNLTANGSAVATNADSPYANAVTAGLQEYAEINSVTFSTNTTVNVRVPETCMIPTSGGISNTYYSTGVNPTGLPYFTKVIGLALNNSGQSNITSSTTVALNGLASTVYLPANSKVKITVSCGTQVSNALANAQTIIVGGITDITVNNNRICEASYQAFSGGSAGYVETTGIYQNTTAGSVTFYGGTRVSANTGTITSDNTRPAYLRVELV